MLEQILRSGGTAPKVIIVDDYYSEPSFEQIDSEALAELHAELDGKRRRQRELANALGSQKIGNLSSLMSLVEANPLPLWTLYRAGARRNQYLRSFFAKVEDSKDADRTSLETISGYFRENLSIQPQHFNSLEAASAALKECVIAFIDFRLKPGLSVKAALQQHSDHKEAYRGKFKVADKTHPKIVYLISSALPNAADLQQFRINTGLRTAFFRPFRKNDVTAELLKSEVSRWAVRYAPAAKLESYLTAVTGAIDKAAKEMLQVLDGLELHDLALLNVFKLNAESQSLQVYLNWLLAECFGSKLRSDPNLQPILLPEEVPFAPMDGKIKLGATLFELFSSIAVSSNHLQNPKPEFGDIFMQIGALSDTRPRDVYLAISPACDLQRCEAAYEVLCVRGRENAAKPDIGVLFEQSEKGLFGKGRHLIGYDHGNKKRYAILDWDKFLLTTICARDLADSAKYVRIARLSELFTHEVKAMALNNASRVGIQTYPTLTLSSHALVRMKFGSVSFEMDASGQQFECAVVIKGRTDEKKATDSRFVVFTEQFVEWMRTSFFTMAETKFTSPLPTKFENIKNFFHQPTNIQLDLKSGLTGTECSGNLRIALVESVNTVDQSSKEGIDISIVFALPAASLPQEES